MKNFLYVLIVGLAILASGCQANRGVIRVERIEVNFSIQPTINPSLAR